jgi:hypothetical protein
MGFLSDMISGAIKTVMIPFAVIDDTINITSGEDTNSTPELLESIAEDATDAIDDFFDGDLL